MEQPQITHQLSKLYPLVGQSCLTKLEGDYILTPEEELKALEHELISRKKHYAYKLSLAGFLPGQIDLKLAEKDWEKELDKEEILKRANSNKSYHLWEKQKRKEEKDLEGEKLKQLKEFWSASNMYKLMKWTCRNTFGKELITNDKTLPLIKTLCFFLSEDPRFESELNYSLNKGLLIRGISGLGKTFLVKCVSENELNPVEIISMIEITDQLKAEGEYELQPKRKIIYLDDVGTEATPVIHYGTHINWFKDFLELYYSKDRSYNRLIISTNNSFAEIENKYGFRVRSRMKDMFNIVDVRGEDMRGK